MWLFKIHWQHIHKGVLSDNVSHRKFFKCDDLAEATNKAERYAKSLSSGDYSVFHLGVIEHE